MSARRDAAAAFFARHHRTVALLAAALALGSAWLTRTLPVHADFSYLLPPSAESVRHLRALEGRARVLGTAMVAVRAAEPGARAAAAQALYERLTALSPDLVSNITFDERVGRRFVWDNRWLFVPLAELEAAQAGLAEGLRGARLGANPLYVDFEDSGPPAGSPLGDAALAKLRARVAEAEAHRDAASTLVGKDGGLQMMVVNTPFPASDVDRAGALLAALNAAMRAVTAEHPGVEVGLAGDVLTAHEEQRAILQSMLWATAMTVVLVVGALLLYFQTALGVLALFAALSVGTLATFAVTKLTIGHLNLATAFLSSIVMGNGINFGIMVLARHLEARRTGLAGGPALSLALGDTLPGTAAAALTAATAYLSLVVTDFRGFRHFGIIGGVGMGLCWLSAYTVLPALLAALEGRGLLRARPEPALGRHLARLLPRQPGRAVALGLVLAGLALGGAWSFLHHDPYEANFKNLRSDSPALVAERRWMHAIDEAFGQGISGGFVIGVQKREEVAPLVGRLRALDEGKPAAERLFSRVNALDDALPGDQERKLKVLGEIRALMDDATLAHLSPADRAEALRLRPPANLRALGDADVPESLAWPFIEMDGSRGRLVLAMSGWGYEIWNAHDLVRFADRVRALDLGDGVLLGGSAFVFSDMLRMVERDGPRATLTACLGAAAAILCVLGWRRHTLVTLACGALGTLAMLALGGALGLKINFLDFVALPITIGIGIDYAVNICARARIEGRGQARRALSTAGGAVFLSSYTTIVGYGALLLSSNRGIRSFGSAAILGELTCLAAALIFAPALLDFFEGGPVRPTPTLNGKPQPRRQHAIRRAQLDGQSS